MPDRFCTLSRRAVVKGLALGAAVAAAPRLRADAAPKLDVHDPAAVKLGYVENVRQVDTQRFPQFVPGSSCENCLQLQGKPGDNFRPCSLFSGKLVSVSGWCSGWAAEM